MKNEREENREQDRTVSNFSEETWLLAVAAGSSPSPFLPGCLRELLCVLNRCKTLYAFIRRIDHPVGHSWRRWQVGCSWWTDKRVFGTWNGCSQVWSGGQNLLKSGSAWPQSLGSQPHSSCLACWQATAVFLKERPWGISSASHQSQGINVETDGVNGGGWASRRAGSVQTPVNLSLITTACLRWTWNAQL